MSPFSLKRAAIAVAVSTLALNACADQSAQAPTGQVQIQPAQNKMVVLPSNMTLGSAIIHPPRATDGFGSMEAQTIGTFNGLHNLLKKQGLTLGNVMRVRATLSADEHGTVDYAGYKAGYDKFFGTKELPSEPLNVVTAAASLPVMGQMILIEADIAVPVKPKPVAETPAQKEN